MYGKAKLTEKSGNFHLFIFLDRQTINGNGRLLFQQMWPSMVIYVLGACIFLSVFCYKKKPRGKRATKY
jgi:hypothetical protein